MGMNPEKRKTVFEKTRGFCWYCGRSITIDDFQVDHVKPKYHGTDNSISNLVPSCVTCNAIKGSDTTLNHLRICLGKRILKNVTFTPAQKAFFDRNGIVIPDQPEFTFYFEKYGLESFA